MEQSYVIRNDRVIGRTVPNINYNYSTCPIGSIFAFSSERIPLGFFICDGASYKVAEYPDLYAVIGNTYGGDTENFNVPDYRETVLVGVGENTTDTIASHDVYELGEFKDDQLQSHTHGATHNDSGSGYGHPQNDSWYFSTMGVTGVQNARTGTTTHGKQKGVTYIIKAFHTNEGTDSGVSDDVIDYVDNKVDGLISDTSTGDTTSTWSSSMIASEIDAKAPSQTSESLDLNYYDKTWLGDLAVRSVYCENCNVNIPPIKDYAEYTTGTLTVYKLQRGVMQEYRAFAYNNTWIPLTYVRIKVDSTWFGWTLK